MRAASALDTQSGAGSASPAMMVTLPPATCTTSAQTTQAVRWAGRPRRPGRRGSRGRASDRRLVPGERGIAAGHDREVALAEVHRLGVDAVRTGSGPDGRIAAVRGCRAGSAPGRGRRSADTGRTAGAPGRAPSPARRPAPRWACHARRHRAAPTHVASLPETAGEPPARAPPHLARLVGGEPVVQRAQRHDAANPGLRLAHSHLAAPGRDLAPCPAQGPDAPGVDELEPGQVERDAKGSSPSARATPASSRGADHRSSSPESVRSTDPGASSHTSSPKCPSPLSTPAGPCSMARPDSRAPPRSRAANDPGEEPIPCRERSRSGPSAPARASRPRRCCR